MENVTISGKYIPLYLVVILLNCPSFLYSSFIIYETSTDFAGGDYANLVFNYSLINLILLVWGIVVFKANMKIPNFYYLLLLVLLKDIILYFCGNHFSLKSWEMYLSLATGMSCCSIVANTSKSYRCFEKLIDWLIIANFIWQILFIVTGRVGESGRVSVMGQGAGSVGFMYAMEIVYILVYRLKEKKGLVLLCLSLFGIVISGSRFSLIIVFVSLFFFHGQLLKNYSRKMKITFILLLTVLGLGVTYTLLNAELQNQYAIIERMSGMYNANEMADDQSLLERIESFSVGLSLIPTHPLGLSFTYGDLQWNMIYGGFFAFPHSTILCYYLFWGPIMIYCIYWLIKYIFISRRLKLSKEKNMLLYLLLIFIIYGGVCISTKDVVFHIALLAVIMRRVLTEKDKMKHSYHMIKS